MKDSVCVCVCVCVRRGWVGGRAEMTIQITSQREKCPPVVKGRGILVSGLGVNIAPYLLKGIRVFV